MYFLIDVANFKSSEKKKRKPVKGAIQITGGAYVGQQAVRSGVPRLLGVRLESHSTGYKKANEILKSGYLDPSKSGTGAQKNFDMPNVQANLGSEAERRKANSKGKTFITGLSPDQKVVERMTPDGKKVSVKFNPVTENLYKRFQRKSYRAQGGVDFEKLGKQGPLGDEAQKGARRLLLPFAEHKTGKSLYVGDSDDYYRKTFVPDVDDIAMMTDKKIKVSGNRFGAVKDAIDREGLGNLIKKAPKSRIATGAALLGLGGYSAYKLTKTGSENINGGPVKVKGFLRKGKVVKGYSRKRLKK